VPRQIKKTTEDFFCGLFDIDNPAEILYICRTSK